MADENPTTNDPLDPETLGEQLALLAAADAREARVALAERLIGFMRACARDCASRQEVDSAIHAGTKDVRAEFDALCYEMHMLRSHVRAAYSMLQDIDGYGEEDSPHGEELCDVGFALLNASAKLQEFHARIDALSVAA